MESFTTETVVIKLSELTEILRRIYPKLPPIKHLRRPVNGGETTVPAIGDLIFSAVKTFDQEAD